MARGGSRAGRGRGIPIAPSNSTPSSYIPPSVESSGLAVASPVSSPPDSTSPPISSSEVGSSAGSGLTLISAKNKSLLASILKHSQRYSSRGSTLLGIVGRLCRMTTKSHTSRNLRSEYAHIVEEVMVLLMLIILRKFYKWDASIDKLVHEAFQTQGSKRYTDMVCHYKRKRFSIGKPTTVSEETWRIWEAYWDTPEVKAKSEIQCKNRMSKVAGPGTGCARHVGGSRSAEDHFDALQNELQREPTALEFFKLMHQKKNGQFIDEKSKKVAEEVDQRIVAATQEARESDEPLSIDVSQLFVEVAGGVKKNHIYGLGSKASSYIKGKASCSSSANSQQDAIKEMEQRMNTMQVEMQVQIQAERVAMQAECAAQMAGLLEELRRHGVLPPSMQPPNTQGEPSANSNAADLGDN